MDSVMDSQDRLFEAIYNEAKKARSRARLLKNDFNETWEVIDRNTKAYKAFLKAVKDASTIKSKFAVLDVAKVKGSDHYVGIVYGGLNGPGNWNNYFKDLGKIINKGLKNVWLIDVINDCADDVFTARFGFRI